MLESSIKLKWVSYGCNDSFHNPKLWYEWNCNNSLCLDNEWQKILKMSAGEEDFMSDFFFFFALSISSRYWQPLRVHSDTLEWGRYRPNTDTCYRDLPYLILIINLAIFFFSSISIRIQLLDLFNPKIDKNVEHCLTCLKHNKMIYTYKIVKTYCMFLILLYNEFIQNT